MEVTCKAAAFAVIAHGDQLYGERPYSYHLQAVAAVLIDAGIMNPDLLAAAWLHDVIEDTPVTHEQLTEAFGPVIADLAWECTGVGKNRTERNASIYRKITDRSALVKVADRIANVETSTRDSKHRSMYRKERAAFWNAVARRVPVSLQQRLDAAYDKD